jgi:hypothetical protein
VEERGARVSVQVGGSRVQLTTQRLDSRNSSVGRIWEYHDEGRSTFSAAVLGF